MISGGVACRQQPGHPGTVAAYAARKAIGDESSARTAAAEVTSD
jgi:hypothetical protein